MRKLREQNTIFFIRGLVKSSELPTMYASSPSFRLRSSCTALRICFTISGVIISLGRPLQCSSWQLVRPRLNYASQYFTVVKEGADSLKGWICALSHPPPPVTLSGAVHTDVSPGQDCLTKELPTGCDADGR
ncbi:hypothetical protein TNCV_5021611 [Trichonephila clavipes]|nr:hypothetical protein TNCV_5021611 [Trichonephila clavipes]